MENWWHFHKELYKSWISIHKLWQDMTIFLKKGTKRRGEEMDLHMSVLNLLVFVSVGLCLMLCKQVYILGVRHGFSFWTCVVILTWKKWVSYIFHEDIPTTNFKVSLTSFILVVTNKKPRNDLSILTHLFRQL